MGPRYSRHRVSYDNTGQLNDEEGSWTQQNVMDTLTMAKQERQRYGFCDVEVSYGGEADLHRHVFDCEKNPGHAKFIPVDAFNIDLLPAHYQDNDIVDFIRVISDLTVRVAVKKVSLERPNSNRGRTSQCESLKFERDPMTTGTGWVYGVNTFSNSKKIKKCTCKECRASKSPKRSFAHIHVRTVNHLVFDRIEGAHTTCHLFFNNGGTPDLCSGVVELKGMSNVVSDIDSDTCQMRHVTHDMELARRLRELLHQQQVTLDKLTEKYGSRLLPFRLPEEQPEHTLTVIVSHPHGCSKQVSVGHYTDRKWIKTLWTSYTYNTATCSGSSGALVFVLGSCNLVFDHAHSGGNSEFNYSSYGID